MTTTEDSSSDSSDDDDNDLELVPNAMMEDANLVNSATGYVLMVTGKDLFILMLLIVNICTMTILISKCTKCDESLGREVIYKAVSVISENERLRT